MSQEVARRVLDAAAASDRAAAADEATLMALRTGTLEVHCAGEHAVALVRDGDLTLVVHPEHRGQGLGGKLLSQVLHDHAQDIETAWSHTDHPAAARLAAVNDFARVRDLWVMRRPTTGLADLDHPNAITIRGFQDADIDAIVSINAAAFASHPEQGAMDAADFAARVEENHTTSGDLLVAEKASQLVGFHWTKMHSPILGEVYVVGVAPEAQGQGLGKTLTLAGLRHLAQRGAEEILLYVESDNLPAIATYQRLGFTHDADDTHVQYRRHPALPR